jgi:hypothetical protein
LIRKPRLNPPTRTQAWFSDQEVIKPIDLMQSGQTNLHWVTSSW